MLPSIPLSNGHLGHHQIKRYWDDGFLFPDPGNGA